MPDINNRTPRRVYAGERKAPVNSYLMTVSNTQIAVQLQTQYFSNNSTAELQHFHPEITGVLNQIKFF